MKMFASCLSLRITAMALSFLHLGACASGGAFNPEAAPLIENPQPKLFIPDFKQTRLANGIRIYVNTDPALPAAAISIGFRGGMLEEPIDQAGKTALLANTLVEATQRFGRSELAAAFDDTASVWTHVSADALSLHATVLLDRLDPFWLVLGEMILRPGIGQDDFERLRLHLEQQRRDALLDLDEVADQTILRAMYGDEHRMSLPVEGSAQSLAGLSRDQVNEWRDALIRPENMVIAVSGRVQVPFIMGQLSKLFSSWRPPAAKAHRRAPTALLFNEAPTRNTVLAFARDDVSQTAIRVGRVGPPATSLDGMVLGYFGMVAAGHSSSYLRSLDGVTYGVGGSYEKGNGFGHVYVATSVENGSVSKALDSILSSCRRMGNVELSNEFWSVASTSILFRENRADYEVGGRASALVRRVLEGLAPDHVKQLHDHLADMRADDFAKLSREFFSPERFQIAMVGPRASITAATKDMSFTKLRWVQ